MHSNEWEERTGGFTSGLFSTSHCVSSEWFLWRNERGEKIWKRRDFPQLNFPRDSRFWSRCFSFLWRRSNICKHRANDDDSWLRRASPKKEQKNESFVWCPVFYESKVLCGTIPESTTHRTTTNTNNTRRREREFVHHHQIISFCRARKFASRTFTLRSIGTGERHFLPLKFNE